MRDLKEEGARVHTSFALSYCYKTLQLSSTYPKTTHENFSDATTSEHCFYVKNLDTSRALLFRMFLSN